MSISSSSIMLLNVSLVYCCILLLYTFFFFFVKARYLKDACTYDTISILFRGIRIGEERSACPRKNILLCKIFYLGCRLVEPKDFYKFFTEERGRNAMLLLTRLHLFSNLLLRSSLSLWSGLFGQRMSWSWPKMQQSFRERPGTNASRDFAVPLPSVELCFSFARFHHPLPFDNYMSDKILEYSSGISWFTRTLFQVFFAIRYF